MIVKAIVRPAAEGGFWAEVSALPGCVTQGESLEEIRGSLQEAIAGWLEAGNRDERLMQAGQILELAL